MERFRTLFQASGLTQREAAKLLDVNLHTVRLWAAEGKKAPDGVLKELLPYALRRNTLLFSEILQVEESLK